MKLSCFGIPLANKYAAWKIDGPARIEPKLDGINISIFNVGGRCEAVTRQGQIIPCLRPLASAFDRVIGYNVVIGELLIGSDIRANRGNANVARIENKIYSGDASGLTFHAFTLASKSIHSNQKRDERTYSQRRALLLEMIRKIKNENIFIVDSIVCMTKKELTETHREHIKAGLEGSMVKSLASGAYRGRSDQELKWKPKAQ